MDSRPLCRFCLGSLVVRWCRRWNISSVKQRWLCKRCGRTFTPDDGFLWRHHKPEVIVEALSLHIRGLSQLEASDHLWQNHAVKLNWGTICRWIMDYSGMLSRFIAHLRPRLKGSIHVDEVVVKVTGRKAYRWGAIDRVTKYKISGPLTWKRSYLWGAKPLYQQLRDNCDGLPSRIVSDKLGHYKRAFSKYFRRTGVRLIHGVPIACRRYGLKHNNNPAERDNGRVKTRIKTMRSFKDKRCCKRFLDLLDIHHNYIKPSLSLEGAYPAEKAGVKLPLGRNRLTSLIHLSA